MPVRILAGEEPVGELDGGQVPPEHPVQKRRVVVALLAAALVADGELVGDAEQRALVLAPISVRISARRSSRIPARVIAAERLSCSVASRPRNRAIACPTLLATLDPGWRGHAREVGAGVVGTWTRRPVSSPASASRSSTPLASSSVLTSTGTPRPVSVAKSL